MTDQSQTPQKSATLLDHAKVIRRQRRRDMLDIFARYGVGFGGISVIIAITLIFFYLALVVFPLFKPTSMDKLVTYAIPGGADASTLSLSIEEQNEFALRITNSGKAIFFKLADGSVVQAYDFPVPAKTTITSHANGALGTGVVGLGLSDGTVLIAKYGYSVTYPDNVRVITPKLEYPLGEKPIKVFEKRQSVSRLSVQSAEENSTIVAVSDKGEMAVVAVSAETSFLGDVEVKEERGTVSDAPASIRFVITNKDQNALFLVTENGELSHYSLAERAQPSLVERVRVVANGSKITDIRFLAGGVSLLISSDDGHVSQWFTVRGQDNVQRLTKIREFEAPAVGGSILEPEYYRKGFLVGANDGSIALYHATAESRLDIERTSKESVLKIAIAPRADHAIVEDNARKLHVWEIENEHPEISWQSLWGKVWYEGYQEPDYIWQSSSASNDFEPKFSLAPLTFGTLKAAFYAMLLAIPLAILGAAYAAYFMSSRLRQVVKPTIEVMEALPTVILGFLAGLWLAPFVEENLPGIFSLTIILPLGVIAFAYLWNFAPQNVRHAVPDGWQPLLLVPVIALLGWFSLAISPAIEQAWFGGDMPAWLRQMGIDFDQRNSLVVGIAMGFAVIPNIFSIAEDAIFAVPKHLTSGSLALGATPWQTFVRVVLPTASPGIFSAVMIGLGRAVGETMIVLMATGNTPIMDANIFEGLRTLSANIAVEMPESEVNSTHYRVLFLAALVLFMFTFALNTIAEMIRQRLRRKYGNL